MFQDENSNSYQNTFNYDNPNYSNRPNKSRCCSLPKKDSNNINCSVQNGRVKTNYEKKTKTDHLCMTLRNKNQKLLMITPANGPTMPSDSTNSNHQPLDSNLDDSQKNDSMKKNSNKNEAAVVLLKRNSLSTSASSCSLDKEIELETVENNQEKFEKFSRLSYSYRREKKPESKFKKFFSVKLVKNEMNTRLKKKLNYSDNLDDIEIYRV